VSFESVVEGTGKIIDAVGVAAIVLGLAAALATTARQLTHRDVHAYERFRIRLGRAILLGLELLVAADIIRTVAVTPTLERVGVLAGIVIIRTFLSLTLELETTGSWPWQRATAPRHADVDGGLGPAPVPSVEGHSCGVQLPDWLKQRQHTQDGHQ
jgi:uncharacterized membrane protein